MQGKGGQAEKPEERRRGAAPSAGAEQQVSPVGKTRLKIRSFRDTLYVPRQDKCNRSEIRVRVYESRAEA